MIGITTTKNNRRVLTVDSYIDVDATLDILPEYYDCMFIRANSPHTAATILIGISPVLSWKCSYKPVFASKALKGRMNTAGFIIDEFINDINEDKVQDTIDRIERATFKYGIKPEITRSITPNQLFARICRFMLSRDIKLVEHRLIEKSSLGYINPIFEHYHEMGLFHLRELFAFEETMFEFGAFRRDKFLVKQYLCPKCNHSHLIYMECCPKCDSSNLRLQNIIHHFRCANVSPESSYNKGGMLICPKCHRPLRHIGVDYDRPASVYTCNDCNNSFTTPVTKALCCYCEHESLVSELIPHDVINYEITDEGVRVLTQKGITFSQFVNLYDNFMEYPNFVKRIRRQLGEVYGNKVFTLVVAKIWVFNDKKETTKIKESLQGEMCELFLGHKITYFNNIFYVSKTSVTDTFEPDTIRLFRVELSKGISRMASKIEPGEQICYTCNTTNNTDRIPVDQFLRELEFVGAEPDDMYEYTETGEEQTQQETSRISLEEEQAEELNEIKKKKDNTVTHYRRLITLLVVLASVLLAIAALAIFFLA